MEPLNRYVIQALFKDNFEYFSIDVPPNDPIEAEAIVRFQSSRQLLIASVIRSPRAARAAPAQCVGAFTNRVGRAFRTFSQRGIGFAFHICSAYCTMVRSLENCPILATFRIAFRIHCWRSPKTRSTSVCLAT